MQKQKNQKQIVYADVAIHDMPEKVSYKAKENREIKNSILVDCFIMMKMQKKMILHYIMHCMKNHCRKELSFRKYV